MCMCTHLFNTQCWQNYFHRSWYHFFLTPKHWGRYSWSLEKLPPPAWTAASEKGLKTPRISQQNPPTSSPQPTPNILTSLFCGGKGIPHVFNGKKIAFAFLTFFLFLFSMGRGTGKVKQGKEERKAYKLESQILSTIKFSLFLVCLNKLKMWKR